jgi:hypothetical protein
MSGDAGVVRPVVLYAIVLAAYLPGLAFALWSKQATRHPVLLFAFLGLFGFHALGSIAVFTAVASTSKIPYMHGQYAVQLMAQAVIFYVAATTYLLYWHRRQPAGERSFTEHRAFSLLLLALTAGILAAYFSEVRHFLLLDLIAGHINSNNVLEYRLRYTYGLQNYKYYRLGFLVLPAILGSYVILCALFRRQVDTRAVMLMILCVIPSLLLAEKSAVLHIALVFLIAYATYLGLVGLPLVRMVRLRVVAIFMMILIPTIGTYLIYDASYRKQVVLYTNVDKLRDVASRALELQSSSDSPLHQRAVRDLRRASIEFNEHLAKGLSPGEARQLSAESIFWRGLSLPGIAEDSASALSAIAYRIFVVYSESFALVGPFVEQNGRLGGATLPNMRGILPHEQVRAEAVMHAYAYDPGRARDLGAAIEDFPGSLPVSAFAEGYLNFGWTGFVAFGVLCMVSLILVQEILHRSSFLGLFGYALMAWYAYLALTLSMTTVFATFISIIHTAVAVLLAIVYWVMKRFERSPIMDIS